MMLCVRSSCTVSIRQVNEEGKGGADCTVFLYLRSYEVC